MSTATDNWNAARARAHARRITVNGRLIAPLPDHKHGTLNTRQYHGCECQPCFDAERAYTRARDRRATAQRRRRTYRDNRTLVDGRWIATTAPQHGTVYSYSDCGCRCDTCRDAARRRQREYRRQRSGEN